MHTFFYTWCILCKFAYVSSSHLACAEIHSAYFALSYICDFLFATLIVLQPLKVDPFLIHKSPADFLSATCVKMQRSCCYFMHCFQSKYFEFKLYY